MKNNILKSFILLLLLTACKKDKPADGEKQSAVPVSLMLPKANEVCASGEISAGESLINFSWKKNDGADIFELVTKNLKTGVINTYQSSTTQFALKLPINTPFSWYVRSSFSKSSGSSQSDIWRFYTSGPGATSYAPFPADKLVPEFKQAVTAEEGKITLSWIGEDIENNIQGYDVYLGEDPNHIALIKSDLTASSMVINVKSGATYYWKVITKDKKGNQSDSGIYQFLVI